jgi:hypothetical protein
MHNYYKKINVFGPASLKPSNPKKYDTHTWHMLSKRCLGWCRYWLAALYSRSRLHQGNDRITHSLCVIAPGHRVLTFSWQKVHRVVITQHSVWGQDIGGTYHVHYIYSKQSGLIVFLYQSFKDAPLKYKSTIHSWLYVMPCTWNNWFPVESPWYVGLRMSCSAAFQEGIIPRLVLDLVRAVPKLYDLWNIYNYVAMREWQILGVFCGGLRVDYDLVMPYNEVISVITEWWLVRD